MRFRFAGAVALVLMLLVPAAAGAAVRKVEESGANTGDCTVTACKTIQYAVGKGVTGDTIQIGSGTYTETVNTSTNLIFIGAGDEATHVKGPNGSGAAGHPAFVLPNGGSLSSLSAEGGNGAGGASAFNGAYAIVFEPNGLDQDELALEAVSATGGDGGSTAPFTGSPGGGGVLAVAGEGQKTVTAVDSNLVSGEAGGLSTSAAAVIYEEGMNGKFVNSEIDAGLESFSTGLQVAQGATASTDNTTVRGRNGASVEGSFLTLRDSLVVGLQWGLDMSPGFAPAAEVTVIDSVVRANLTAAYVSAGIGNGVSKLTARGSDFFSKGNGESSPAIETHADTSEQPVSVVLHNSIALHEHEGAEQERDLLADGGKIEADHSSFTASFQESGGSAPAPGSGTNVAGDPGFAEPGGFALSPTSPLIDRGDPSMVESGETDIEGMPRSLDGNRDCLAAPDIGAFEVAGQSAACPPKVADAVPVVSGFGISNKTFAPKGKKPAKASRVKRGTKFNYTLSEPAQVAIKIERRKPRKPGKGKPKYAKVTTIGGQQRSGKDATPFSGKVRGKPLKPGKYRATIVATDAAGQASAPHQLNFQIVAG